MAILASLLVIFMAILHIYILVVEVFFWNTPYGHKAFGLKPDFASKTTALAANQGVYNGFLAAGLIWGLIHPVAEFGQQIELFFLALIAVAGIVGAVTSKPKIFFVQTVPATVATLAVLYA